MKRLKTFLLYVLAIIGLWIFSDIIIYISINGTYKYKEAKIYTTSPEIIVGQNKATYVNGYVRGGIKNNTDGIINGKYLKIDMYSQRDVKLGTKYVEINNLQPNEYRDFEMWYKYTGVEYVTLTTTDNIDNATEDEFLSQKMEFYFIVGTLMVLYLI